VGEDHPVAPAEELHGRALDFCVKAHGSHHLLLGLAQIISPRILRNAGVFAIVLPQHHLQPCHFLMVPSHTLQIARQTRIQKGYASWMHRAESIVMEGKAEIATLFVNRVGMSLQQQLGKVCIHNYMRRCPAYAR